MILDSPYRIEGVHEVLARLNEVLSDAHLRLVKVEGRDAVIDRAAREVTERAVTFFQDQVAPKAAELEALLAGYREGVPAAEVQVSLERRFVSAAELAVLLAFAADGVAAERVQVSPERRFVSDDEIAALQAPETYLPAVPTPVATPFVKKALENLSLRADFGAEVDRVADDTEAVKEAFDSGYSFAIPGYAKVSDQIEIPKRALVTGAGRGKSGLLVAALPAGNGPAVRMTAPPGQFSGGGLRDFGIHPLTPGLFAGRSALQIDLTNGEPLAYCDFSFLNLGDFGAASLRLLTAGQQDGLFKCPFRENYWSRGASMSNVGDGVLFDHCVVGPGDHQALYLEPRAGARNIVVNSLNSVASKEVLYVKNGGGVRLRSLNAEYHSYTGGSGAMIVFDGAKHCEVSGSGLINPHEFAHAILFAAGGEADVSGNTIYADVANGKAHFHHYGTGLPSTGLNDCRDWPNEARVAPKILQGATSRWKSLVTDREQVDVNNGWTHGARPVKVAVDGEKLRFEGFMNAGTLTGGTLVSTFPIYARPTGNRSIVVTCLVSGGYAVGVLSLAPTGALTVTNIPAGATAVIFDGATCSL